jgi:hypothetical protein
VGYVIEIPHVVIVVPKDAMSALLHFCTSALSCLSSGEKGWSVEEAYHSLPRDAGVRGKYYLFFTGKEGCRWVSIFYWRCLS